MNPHDPKYGYVELGWFLLVIVLFLTIFLQGCTSLRDPDGLQKEFLTCMYGCY